MLHVLNLVLKLTNLQCAFPHGINPLLNCGGCDCADRLWWGLSVDRLPPLAGPPGCSLVVRPLGCFQISVMKTLPGIPWCGRLGGVPGSSLGERSRTGKPTWTLLCPQHHLPAAPQPHSYHWPWEEILGII